VFVTDNGLYRINRWRNRGGRMGLGPPLLFLGGLSPPLLNVEFCLNKFKWRN